MLRQECRGPKGPILRDREDFVMLACSDDFENLCVEIISIEGKDKLRKIQVRVALNTRM